MNGNIDGVVVTPLKRIPDERGAVYHMLRKDDSVFKQFGEVYFSIVHPGAIKAWHMHKLMTLNYAVVAGKIKMVLYDGRKDSKTKENIMEIFLGKDNYCLVTVPPGIVNGFKGLGKEDSIVVNCATHPHDPNEIKRIDPFTKDIPYNWDIRHG
ncbi:dTDP-4-dehydrorhamnose 3,5-epimerase family protein [Candidatus Woesearchaeota archaeon]|nr:dTDP-4-dehydrorhamnose 3,5-epimerase family protein [Candidatus Woesearchaeota archaeon]